jgi:tRNA (mo5U34)-methyltransferase
VKAPTKRQVEDMNKHEWFHALDLGYVETSGRFPEGSPQNQTLFTVFDFLKDIDVSEMDCLDIGATDGLISFGLERLGAKSVVATDRVPGVGFSIAHELIGSKVEILQPVEISTLEASVGNRKFDLIVCAGVIYHMLNPLDAFLTCRSLLKPNGLLIMESAMNFSIDLPALILNSETEDSMESSTYWTATPNAMVGIMKLVMFDVLGVRWMNPFLARGAVLGRAVVDPHEIGDRSTLLRAMHRHGLLDYSFNEKLKDANSGSPSRINYRGTRANANIDPFSYKTDFPFHAQFPRSPVGKRDWKVVEK